MAVCGPLLDAANRVSLEDAIVGERWSDPNIGQLRKISINVLPKTQFNRLLNRLGRSCDEPNRRNQENQKSNPSASHIDWRYQVVWLLPNDQAVVGSFLHDAARRYRFP